MDCLHLSYQIRCWLTGQINTTKQKGFVVGVSGGIDSAVVSTLCAQTGVPTLAISLPIHQGRSEHKRGEKHLEWLAANYPNVTVKTSDLTSILDSYQEYMHSVDLAIDDALVAANMRSRLRMLTLYAFANAHGYLVVGTGNKIEDYGIGFFSKFGDGGVDISPIGDLLKSEVRELAVFLQIESDIVTAKPTDGLWDDGRSDEDQIGASYDELEWAMEWLSVNGLTFCAGVAHAELTQRQRDVLAIYLKRHNANRHKMQMPPICTVERI